MRRTFDFLVDGTPEDVSARLQAQTRLRFIKHMSSILGRGGFQGRVHDTSFSVAPDPRHFIQRQHAVANGTFQAEGDQTRVQGTIAPTAFSMWSARIAFILAVLVLGSSAITAAATGVGPFVAAAALMGLILMVAVVTLGWQMNNVEASIEPLEEQLRTALQTSTAPDEVQVEGQRRPLSRATVASR